jgi:choice-of-anchor B domain-containing protein
MRLRIALGALATASLCAIAVGHGDKGGGVPTPSGLSGFSSENVRLLGRISLQEFGSTQGNDCWGYVSPSGREYALMGLYAKTSVVEITDPTNPTVVGEIAHPGSIWSDMKVYGSYAYVVTDAVGSGLQVINLSDVDNGNVTLQATVSQQGFAYAHNVAVNEDSGFVYTLGSNAPSDGLVAWDVSNPASPTIAGTYSTGGYVHDAHVLTMTSGPWAGQEIAFLFIENRGIDIVNVTNKSSMQRLATRNYTGVQYSHQGWFDASTNLLYQNDELDEGATVGTTTTRVWDCSDLTNPVLVNTFTTGLPAVDHNNYSHEGFLYQANYRSGLRIFDLRTNPTDPTEVGWFDTFSASDSAQFNGAWSVYPYFPSGNAIISDLEGGLFVVDPSWARLGGPPLLFDFPGGLPAQTPATGAVVQVEITGQNGGFVASGTPTLSYLDGTGAQVDVALAPLGGDLWEAALPAAACGDTLVYWFSAESPVGGAVSSPINAPFDTYSASVGPDPTLAFADTFEANEGWSAGAAGDTATSGLWVRADPVGTIAQPELDSDDPGALCFVTGNASPGAGDGANDVDNGITTLVSPTLNAVGATTARVRCKVWWSNDLGGNPGEDSMLVEVSNDNGATWLPLAQIQVATNAWVEQVWSLGDVVALTSQMRVRFIARDLGLGSLVEAGVDDFRFELQTCGEPADLNGDGFVDGADLGLLLGEWGGPGAGDLNGDGTVDGADLGVLLGAWG